MAEMDLRRGIAGLLFLEGVGQGYNVISATNSSPQTTEVYGDGPRLKSLMKWVWIGHAQVIIFMSLASIIAKSIWPLVGGGLVVGTMHGCYKHARKCAQEGDTTTGVGQATGGKQGGGTGQNAPPPILPGITQPPLRNRP